MIPDQLFKGRYRLLFTVLGIFIFTSFLVRTALVCISIQKADFSILGLIRIYLLGLSYDIGVPKNLDLLSDSSGSFLVTHAKFWAKKSPAKCAYVRGMRGVVDANMGNIYKIKQ